MKYHLSAVDTSIYLLNFLHTVINSLWKNFNKMCLTIFFPKFSFSNKVWFCPDIFSRSLFGQPLPIFVVLIFSKESRFQRSLLFFIPRLNIFLIPSWAKWPGWKISERFLILRIKSRSTMIVKNLSNKNLSKFSLEAKFRSIFER